MTVRFTKMPYIPSVATFLHFASNATRMAILLLAILGPGSCNRASEIDSLSTKEKYVLYVRAKDGHEYLKAVDDLGRGEARPVAEGIPLDKTNLSRELIFENGSYFHFDYQNRNLEKFQLDNGKLLILDTLSIPGFSLENFVRLGKDSLLLLGLDSGYRRSLYALVNTARMQVVSEGMLPLPGPRAGENSMSIGLAKINEDTLLVGYNFVTVSKESYATSDTIWIGAFRFPEMNLLQVTGDARSAYPGGLNTIQPYSFTDGHGDYYFISSPGILMGHRDDRPTAIFRIRKGQVVTDQGYMVNVSAATGDHAYGMWPLGNGRAVVRSEKKGSYTGWNDYHNVHQFSYYIVELQTGSMKRLPLPLDKGGRKDAVKIIGNSAFISVNSASEGNFIWKYDLATGALSRGLRLEDDVDYIFRIDILR